MATYSALVNNGTIIASSDTLDVTGALTGTGVVLFDQEDTAGNTGATAELNSVSAGQTIVMNGSGTLQLDSLASFAGTIVAQPGDSIVMPGVTANSAVFNAGTLIVSDDDSVVGNLAIVNTTADETFTATGSIITAGTAGLEAANFSILDSTTDTPSVATGTAYAGPVTGLNWQYLSISADNLNVTANVPNVFIHSKSGDDALDVSHVNGNNVLGGGAGSNFLVGGTGDDSFFLDDRNPTASLWSTIVNFHSGDVATVSGLNANDFQVTTADNLGAVGYTGLTFTFTKVGQVPVSLTLAGFSSADLTNGRLSLRYGQTQDLPTRDYLLIHGN